jgi:Kef-type K+ transport system membrane component KefB
MNIHFPLFASSAVGSGAEDLTKRLFLQIVVILCVTQVVVRISRRFLGQTNVAGEILAGIVLGPSVLGAIAPNVSATIFHPSTSPIFVGLAQLALVLLMFQIGMEFEFGTSSSAWLQCGLVCTIAFVGKLGGAYVAARACGEQHRHALAIGVCMNTRALMELIALNIGYDLGVLPRQMYTMLVIMALVSTYMATPLIRWLMSKERAPAQPPKFLVDPV